LRGGRTVKVQPGFNSSELERLLQVLVRNGRRRAYRLTEVSGMNETTAGTASMAGQKKLFWACFIALTATSGLGIED